MILPHRTSERGSDFREVVVAWLLAAIMLVGPALLSSGATNTPTDNFIASRLAVPNFPLSGMPGGMKEHDDSVICNSNNPDEEQIVPCLSRQVARLGTQSEDSYESEVC